MNDNELLKLSAKAYGVKVDYRSGSDAYYYDDPKTGREQWKPLWDGGQALRLAVKCGIRIIPYTNSQKTKDFTRAFAGKDFDELHNDDSESATCRAIVRAAAEIGKAMP